ncbi:hypothetical protein AAMO2058_000108500 [Amorphochlora amoebiformis]
MSYVGNIRPYGSGKWGSHGKANANVPAEEMMKSVWRDVVAILTYQGSWWDCLLNYGMTVPALYILYVCGKKKSTGIQMRWGLWLVALISYQLSLCLFLFECVGISIVWNTVLAWMLLESRMLDSSVESDAHICNVLFWGVVSAIVVNFYYLVFDEFITTVAHVLSWGLGFAIFYCDRKCG